MQVQVPKAMLFSESDTAPPQRREIPEGEKKSGLNESFMLKKKKNCHRQEIVFDGSLTWIKHSSEHNQGRFYSSTYNYKEIKATGTQSLIEVSK